MITTIVTFVVGVGVGAAVSVYKNQIIAKVKGLFKKKEASVPSPAPVGANAVPSEAKSDEPSQFSPQAPK